MCACLSAYNLGRDKAIVSKFSGWLQESHVMVLGTKKLRVVDRGLKCTHLFLAAPAPVGSWE